MRRTLILAMVTTMFVTVVSAPGWAAQPETFRTSSSMLYAAYSDGPQQVEFSVGESDDEMGYNFYVNVRLCDYEPAVGPPVCWQDTNTNVVVHDFNVTKKGGVLDADVEMRSVFDSAAPLRVIRVTAEFTPADPQVRRATSVNHDSEYGFTKVTSVSYSDQSPDTVLQFDEWLIDMPLPSLNYASFNLNSSQVVTK